MCVKNKTFKFEGDFYSERFSYVEVKVWKCVNSSDYNEC
jgi:hypothetical protein